jgi:hypothetical protein
VTAFIWFVIGILGTIFHGFVLSVLWGWFVYGIFTVVPLGVAHAVGLVTTVKLITAQYIEQETQTWEIVCFEIFVALFALLTGWVAHLFM